MVGPDSDHVYFPDKGKNMKDYDAAGSLPIGVQTFNGNDAVMWVVRDEVGEIKPNSYATFDCPESGCKIAPFFDPALRLHADYYNLNFFNGWIDPSGAKTTHQSLYVTSTKAESWPKDSHSTCSVGIYYQTLNGLDCTMDVSFTYALVDGGGCNTDIWGANEGVTVFQHCSYGGYSMTLGEGSYKLSALKALSISNDDLSSIKVPSGYKVVLYEHDNFAGKTLTLTETNDSCLTDNNFNDTVSSIKVQKL